MLKKPSFLLFFSIFLILEPLITIAFISIEKEFSFLHVLQRTFELAPIEIFNFWVLFPISGILLISIRSYSYILFILIQIYNLIFHLSYESFSWPYLSNTPSPSSIVLLVINIIIVIYLLLPDTRRPFFDRNIRWWERASRFSINEPCFLTVGGEVHKGTLIDFSDSGALVGLNSNCLAPGASLKIDFQLLGKDYELDAEVVRKIDDDKENELQRFGLQFNFKTIWERYAIRFLRASITKSNKYPKYRE